MIELLTTMTPEQVEARLLELLAAHDNDPAAHDLTNLLAALTNAVNTQRINVLYDMFNRANGPLGGSTPTAGPAWRNAFGTTTAAISNNAVIATGGTIGIVMADIAGHQLGGVTIQSATINFGATGDAWLYAWFSEGTPSGVVCQRGSDRVRVGTQSGGAVTWAQESMSNASNTTQRLMLRVDAATRKATVSLDGKVVIDSVQLPTIAWGNSVGLRLSGSAIIDEYTSLREVTL